MGLWGWMRLCFGVSVPLGGMCVHEREIVRVCGSVGVALRIAWRLACATLVAPLQLVTGAGTGLCPSSCT